MFKKLLEQCRSEILSSLKKTEKIDQLPLISLCKATDTMNFRPKKLIEDRTSLETLYLNSSAINHAPSQNKKINEQTDEYMNE